ncbi:MAG: NYN domain-containing protein [Coriobacteriia bacterium]|nr:NYN domain-containing protein [Coriobacteriia bacterium]
MTDDAHSLAVFIDFENLAIGFERKPAAKGRAKKAEPDAFDMGLVLERLVEKGKILVKTAYADWGRFSQYVTPLHDAGIQLMEIPERGMTGKNYADIKLCVDAMDLCYAKEHIDTFVVVSGDSDFTPLVSKLKENGKRVIGLGMRDSTSDLLANNCDEFIYYEDLGQAPSEPATPLSSVPKAKRPAMRLLIESIQALQRENVDVMHSSMVKDTMKRKQPSFTESQYGFKNFSTLLEGARELGLVTLRKDPRSGTYVVEGFAGER